VRTWSPVHRIALATLLSLAFAACATPLPDDPAAAFDELLATHVLPDVVRQLRSNDPATVAWGGFLAQRQRLVAAAPEVRSALARWSADPTESGECVRLALLDALVQLDADLTDAELAPHLRGNTHSTAFVIAARRPGEHLDSLLATFRAGGSMVGADWIAAGHLLAKKEAPGFDRALLDAVRRLPAFVDSHPVEPEVVFSGPAYSCGRVRRVTGFPPVATVLLEFGAHDEVLARSEPPVCWYRYVGGRAGITGGLCQYPHPWIGRWLAALDDLGPAWKPEPVLVASSADQYRQRIGALRRDRSAWLAAKTAALQAAGRLTADDAAALCREAEIVVEDRRYPAEPPLPEVPGVRVFSPFVP
jgi:hypothetical protein